MRTRRLMALGTAVLLALTACGGDDEPAAEPTVQVDGSPSPSATPGQETASGDPSPDALRAHYPGIGLEFTGLGEVPERFRPALETYMAFERGHFTMVRTARLNPLLTDSATPAALDLMRQTVDYLQENNTRFRGEVRLEILDVQGRDRVVVIDTCEDSSGLRLVEAGEPKPLEGRSRIPVRFDLNREAGRWLITGYTPREGTC
jgi:hypothetical protein